MRFFNLAVAALAGFIAMAGPSYAQTARTWVSGVGDDANPCSRTAPCQTFSNALTKTSAGGEISCLDPGGFGTMVITKSVTLYCDGAVAGVLSPGVNGIVINAAATDKIILRGLDIEGTGTGLNGVNILNAGSVQIEKCNIRRFTGNGVNVTSSSQARVTITDSTISLNAGGVNVKGNGVGNSANINNTVIDGNTSFGVQTDGAGNAVSIFRSSILGSPTGVSILNGSVIASRGPSNVITGAKAGLTPINFD